MAVAAVAVLRYLFGLVPIHGTLSLGFDDMGIWRDLACALFEGSFRFQLVNFDYGRNKGIRRKVFVV